MTYKKILLSGLFLTLNSSVFCERFFKQLFLEKLSEIFNSIKSGANLLQSAAPAGSNTGNNAAGAATKPHNNGAASVPSGAAGAAAPVKINTYLAKKFLEDEASQVRYDLYCGKYSGPKSVGCVLGQSHRVILIYIRKNFEKNENLYLKQIENYITERINDLTNEYNNPYFDEISQTLDWYDSLRDYKKDALEAINRYKQIYKEIFGKSI